MTDTLWVLKPIHVVYSSTKAQTQAKNTGGFFLQISIVTKDVYEIMNFENI